MNLHAETPNSEREETRVAALKAFFASWRAAAVYDENNHGYQARRADLASALEAVFDSEGEFSVTYQNDYFFINGERLSYARVFTIGRSLAARFAELSLGGFTISATASADAIDRAIFALAQADRQATNPFLALSDTWTSLGIEGVSIKALPAHTQDVFGDAGSAAGIDPRTIRRRRARTLFHRTEAVVQDFWERIRDRNSFEASPIQRVVHQLIDEVAHDEDVLLEFAALKDFDEYTFYHSVNVSIYSIAVGMRLGLERKQLAALGFAALLHDIGKVKLPRDLITKPTDYDDNDWEQMRRHPSLGALTIANMRRIDAEAALAMAAAFEHHLKMDLSGYPAVTCKRELHLFSRIVTICDVFDAMTAGRVYQKTPVAPDDAIQRMLYKGRDWYDPVVLKAFVSVVGVFPVGSLVRLSDGRAAVVIRNSADDVFCPDVVIVASGEESVEHEEVHLTVESSASSKPLHISAVLEPEKEGVNIYDYIGRDDEVPHTSDIPEIVDN